MNTSFGLVTRRVQDRPFSITFQAIPCKIYMAPTVAATAGWSLIPGPKRDPCSQPSRDAAGCWCLLTLRYPSGQSAITGCRAADRKGIWPKFPGPVASQHLICEPGPTLVLLGKRELVMAAPNTTNSTQPPPTRREVDRWQPTEPTQSPLTCRKGDRPQPTTEPTAHHSLRPHGDAWFPAEPSG